MADDGRVEVRALVWCRCERCCGDPDARPHEDMVTLVDRDALVYRLGVAHLAWEDAAEIAGKVDTVDEWAKVGLADSRRLAALSALRAWDDAHGRTDG